MVTGKYTGNILLGIITKENICTFYPFAVPLYQYWQYYVLQILQYG